MDWTPDGAGRGRIPGSNPGRVGFFTERRRPPLLGAHQDDGGDRDGDRDILDALDDAAGGAHQAEHPAQVAVEHRAGHEQRDVRPHVEQRPAELPHAAGMSTPTANGANWSMVGRWRRSTGRWSRRVCSRRGGRASRVGDGDCDGETATATLQLRGGCCEGEGEDRTMHKRIAVEEKEDRQINVVLPHQLLKIMSSSNRAPQRDGKAPASPVPPSPPAPPLRQSTFSADYWDDFYMGWKMALQKASRHYGDKGLNNILPDIGPRVEHIPSSPSSPDRSGTYPSSHDRSGTSPSSPSSHPSPDHSASSPPCSTEWSYMITVVTCGQEVLLQYTWK
ncbi:hypothetical protein Taro_032942 [Colocasia esculenta]|uniref:Uncharacterized protein n=1 Tax=Colocasia esculenta TaxID=4460 RepID=A0A843VSL6_COLES|nr:hypothetical protein [Colocasia esculenta]